MTNRLALLADQQMRFAAARATQQIALRRGRSLGMYIGCGYPKSGTVWLCQLIAAHMALPYPRDYQLPIMMPSVIHAHWSYDERLPRSAYTMRDGRDVMTSFYFHSIRAMTTGKNPSRAKRIREDFTYLFGPNFDPDDAHGNIAKFIEHEFTSPRATHGVTWPQHIEGWTSRSDVATTSYEALLADTAGELHRLVESMTGVEQDPVRARLAARRFEFRMASTRNSGTEDRSSFLRKGISGDWANTFSREAGQVFDSLAGDTLVEHGYAADRSWWKELPK